MDNDKENEIGNLLTPKEYYLKRLDMAYEKTKTIEKKYMNTTSTTIAIFGGIGIALVYLHTDIVSDFIKIIASLLISVIGIYASSIFLMLVNSAQLNETVAYKEVDFILKALNESYSKKLNFEINDKRKSLQNKFVDRMNQKKHAAALIVDTLCLIRWLMIIYATYSAFALMLSIYCPEAIKIIW